MSLSEEQIQALGSAVAEWRMQEYIYISFFAFYVYYMLTTIDEEVAVVIPQKWNSGKALFLVIRYGTCVCIPLLLSRDYRNYFVISPMNCKALSVLYQAFHHVVSVSCAISLGLCLSALLQVRKLYLIPLTLLCALPNIMIAVFAVVSEFQFPAEPISALDEELGYPCYVVSYETMYEVTITGLGRHVRSYVYFSATAALVVLAVVAVIVRYKGNSSKLIQVLCRDAGLYYVSLAVLRFGQAVIDTPTILQPGRMEGSPVVMLINVSSWIVIPVLAQRLMINLRKVDYVGSEPVASQLLFATLPPDSKRRPEGDGIDSLEMDVGLADRHSHLQSGHGSDNDIEAREPRRGRSSQP